MRSEASKILFGIVIFLVCCVTLGCLFGFEFFLEFDYVLESFESVSGRSATIFYDFAVIDFVYDFLFNFDPFIGQSLNVLYNTDTGFAHSIVLFNFSSGIVGQGDYTYTVLLESSNSALVQYVYDTFESLAGEGAMILYSSHNGFVIPSDSDFPELIEWFVNLGTNVVGFGESIYILVTSLFRIVENMFGVVTDLVYFLFRFVGISFA